MPLTLSAAEAPFRPALRPAAALVAAAFGLALAAMFVLTGFGPGLGGLALVRRDALTVALCAFAGLFVLGFALTTPEILTHNDGRYAFALLPVALFALARLARERGLPTLRLMLAAQCLACAVLAPRAIAGVLESQACVRDHRAVAAWAQANLPPGSHLLIHDAGMIAFASDLPLTDLVGLKFPASIAHHRHWTAPSGGTQRGRALDAIARQAGATHAIIPGDHPGLFWAQLVDEMRAEGWRLDQIYATGPQGWYKLYRLTPPPTAEAETAAAR